MATRVGYPVEIEINAIELRRHTGKEVMEKLNIRNKAQVKTWMR